MWKLVDGKLVHVTDESREEFRTTISQSLLNKLEEMAIKNDTYINYLFENGIENLLKVGMIQYDKKSRPKDRRLYKATYDKNLLKQLREFAEKHKLFINDVMEYSVKYIDLSSIKTKSHKHRIEREE